MAPSVDLRKVARTQRELLWIILALLAMQVVAVVVPLPNTGTWALISLVYAFGLLGAQIVGLVLVVRLASASGSHWSLVTLYAVLMLLPCINLLVLLGINQHATTLLRRRGLAVGLMGVGPAQLLLLDDGRCRGCGYDMTGLPADRCPECGVRFPLAYPGRAHEARPGA